MTFFCHGSNEDPSTIRDGKSFLDLTCVEKRFLTDEGQGTYTIYLKCSDIQQPKIIREPSQCSSVGSDGTTDNLDQLVKVKFGWEVQQGQH